MDQSTSFQFSWGSAYGVSVLLFFLLTAIYFIVGLLTPIFFRLFDTQLSLKFGIVFSPRSDSVAFGRSTAEMIKDNPSALVIKTSVYYMLSGLYLAYAILHLCLVWFGLMRGQSWSLWALVLSNLSIIALYLLAARNYSVHLAPLTFGDLMPFTIVPGLILPIASILGFIGMYSK